MVNDAIAAQRMPGAVVQIGHAGKVVFREAFGSRKLADEPGLHGVPTPAEPMTEDTIFDLASLTKSVATTPAFLQLHEKGLVQIDEPVQRYLPDFNPANDPRRAQVTLRMLLTHTSGIAGDLSLDGPWGLDPADEAEGIRRALGAWVVFDPGTAFHYSDINFILVGAIITKITGEPLGTYVPANVLAPLGMSDTRYLPAAKACGPHQIRGTAITLGQNAPWSGQCPAGTWSTALLPRIAPTAHDGDTPGLNPDFGHLLRGTVHDPTARRMGGATGSAGVFSTADDVGRYAQALLDRLAGRPSTFPLTQATLEVMTSPQQPGHTAGQLEAADNASREATAPNYPALAGQDLRGFGWDIDTAHSRPRGMIFPVGSFGHTGFTGVTLWMDPGSNTYVVILANVIHQRGGPPIAALSGDVATTTAQILGLYGS
nr:serine hydrolase domain-containing protein [Mycolicibacterium hippocampi]